MVRDTKFKKIDILNENSRVIISSNTIFQEDNRIIIKGEDFPIIDHDKKINFIAYYDDGIIFMEGITTLSVDKQINIEVLESGEKKDRRSYIKVKTNDVACLTRAYALCDHNVSYKVNASIKLRDISLGGVCFYSNRVFLKNQRIIINLYNIKMDLLVEAEVLRKNRTKSAFDYKYEYGCKFSNLNNEQQRIICEYVFKLELENHYKELEKDLNVYDD